MYKRQYQEINNSLRTTKKAIIGIGCSFMQGQGALSKELLSDYSWETLSTGRMLLKSSDDRKKILKSKYHLDEVNGELDFTYMEYNNSFLNKLCNKYLNGKYTPINFGMRGNGNRASIKQLYLHPEIDWKYAEEIIVIYMPSGIERFDFASTNFAEHFNFITMWPNYTDASVSGDRKKLWEGYAKTVWGSSHEVLEQIINAQELLTWCQLKNAKLVTLLGFDPRYNREYFLTSLKDYCNNNMFAWCDVIIDSFPWETIIEVGGYKMFLEYTMDQENLPWDDYWSWRGKGTPKKWLSPCCHPSELAHDGYAQMVYNELQKRNIT